MMKKNEPLCQAVHGIYGKPAPNGPLRTANDSASQKILVTVRQIFSADPATGQQALPGTSAVAPFPFRSCTGFAEGTDGYRASIKRFNFDCILARLLPAVNCFFHNFCEFAQKDEKQRRKGRPPWYALPKRPEARLNDTIRESTAYLQKRIRIHTYFDKSTML